MAPSTLSLDSVTALPEVEDGHVDCSSFPRLAKLAARGGKVPEGKLRSLAARFRVELPLSTDLTDAAKVKWVWGLASLAQSITVRATGWLQVGDDSRGVRGLCTRTF